MIEKPEWQGAGAGLLALAKLGINVNIKRLVEFSNTTEMGVSPEDLMDGIKKICTENGVKINISYIPLESIEQLNKEFNTPNTSIIFFANSLPFGTFYNNCHIFVNLDNILDNEEVIYVINVSKGGVNEVKFEYLKEGFKLEKPIQLIILENNNSLFLI
jgi:hypothetical protein